MTREPEKTHRIIYAINVLFWSNQSVVLELNRSGNAIVGRGGDPNHGRPSHPKTRTIDLRIGDEVQIDGSWRRIRGIVCARDAWLTEEEAAALVGEEGFLYRPRKPR
jgi:hypothetical protein